MSNAITGRPTAWTQTTLGELCEVDPEILGASTPRDYRFRYIDISSVSPLAVSAELQETLFALAPSRARKKVRQDDVLMATVRPNLKAFARVKAGEEYVASTGFAVLRAREGISDPRFIEQVLFTSGIESQIEGLVAGSNYPAITVSNVKRLKLMAPRLAEQRRIADLLSAVDEQIGLLEAYAYKKNALLSGLIDALLLVGPRLKTMADFCEVGPKTSALDAPSSVPFVAMDSVSEAGVLAHREHRLWVAVSKGFTRFTGGDVLVAKITPCFENGKGFQAPGDAKLWAGSTEFHVLRAKEGASSRWLFWHTRSREFLAKGAMQMTGSAGQQRVPRRFIEGFQVLDDKLAVQEKKAALLDAVSAELQEVEAQIEKLKKQKQGLLGDLLQQSPSQLQTAVVKHDQ